MARGDITASEIFKDRALLERLGYGIFDVAWGKDWIGSENIRDFSYIVATDIDPKIYRHKVFETLGLYFENKLAKELWYKFLEHKIKLSEQAGREIPLQEAAQDWFQNCGHAFLKDWALHLAQVPERIRSHHEPRKNWPGIMAEHVLPDLSELLNAGFSVGDIFRATLHAGKPRSKGHFLALNRVAPHEQGQFYMRLVANLTGHHISTPEEAAQRWREILEHKLYLSEHEGHEVNVHTAALDYYRRLNLLQEIEAGDE